MGWREDLIIQAEEKRSHNRIRCLHTCNAHTIAQCTLLQFSRTMYSARLHTSLPYTPTPTNLHKPKHNHHTNPTKHTYTLHTYPTPTYIPCIPTLPLKTYTTLHIYPTPTYLPYPYNPYTLLCMSALFLHTCFMSRQSGGAVAFCPWWDSVCCEIYCRNYCTWVCLMCWEPPG